MDVIVGPPLHQRKAVKIEPPPRKSRLQDFRVGLWLDDPAFPPDTEVGDCLQDIVDRLARAGANLTTEKPEVDLGECHRLRNDLNTMTMSHTEAEGNFNWAVSRRPTLKDDDQSGEAAWIRAVTVYHRDWNIIDVTRAVLRQKWEDYFQKFDVLLCPVARIAAHHHDYTELPKRFVKCNGKDLNYWDVIGPWNSLSLVGYLPATVAPIGFTPAGLPVGIQIIGPYLEDRTPIQFAMLLEEEITGSFGLPPGFES